MLRTKDIYRTGMAILSDGIRIPKWWAGKSYEAMRKDWSHSTLLASVEDDIMNGDVPPREVLDHFPEIR